MSAIVRQLDQVPKDLETTCAICRDTVSESMGRTWAVHDDANGDKHPFHVQCIVAQYASTPKGDCPSCHTELDFSAIFASPQQRVAKVLFKHGAYISGVVSFGTACLVASKIINIVEPLCHELISTYGSHVAFLADVAVGAGLALAAKPLVKKLFDDIEPATRSAAVTGSVAGLLNNDFLNGSNLLLTGFKIHIISMGINVYVTSHVQHTPLFTLLNGAVLGGINILTVASGICSGLLARRCVSTIIHGIAMRLFGT